MVGELRGGLRTRPRTGRGQTFPVAVVLALLVIFAAGLSGPSKFTGARWFPELGGAHGGLRTATRVLPTTTIAARGLHRHSSDGAVPIWLVVTVSVLVALALTALVWRLWRGRRLPAAPEFAGPCLPGGTKPAVQAEAEPEPEKLLTGIEAALQTLEEVREPADAVVRAWLGLQDTAEESGIVRRSSETPTEFASRILSRAFADDRALRTLLRLYLRTRFSDHPVSAQDVSEVRAALQQLVSSWRPTSRAARAR